MRAFNSVEKAQLTCFLLRLASGWENIFPQSRSNDDHELGPHFSERLPMKRSCSAAAAQLFSLFFSFFFANGLLTSASDHRPRLISSLRASCHLLEHSVRILSITYELMFRGNKRSGCLVPTNGETRAQLAIQHISISALHEVSRPIPTLFHTN